jgi:NHLM bacteriocin system ABC transporter ATP-binding protein
MTNTNSDLQTAYSENSLPNKIQNEAKEQVPPTDYCYTSLISVCQILADAYSFRLVVPTSFSTTPAQSTEQILLKLAEISQFRVRSVKLEAGWWRSDNGPLLAFTTQQQPLALLPVSARSYVAVNPAQGTQVRVTEEVAASLDNTAYTFYRPLPQKTSGLLHLLHFGFRGSHCDLVATMLLGLGISLLNLITPLVIGLLFDRVIPAGQMPLLAQVLFGLVVIALSAAILNLVRGLALIRVSSRLEVVIEAALWDRLLKLSPSFFRRYTAGDLADRVNGFATIQRLISDNTVTSLLNGFFSCTSLVLLLTLNLVMGLVALGLVLVTLIVLLAFNLWLLRYRQEMMQSQGRLAGVVLQLINGVAKLRAADAEARGFAHWATYFGKQRQLTFIVRTLTNWQMVFSQTWAIISLLVIFVSAGLLQPGQLTSGMLLAFLATFSQLLATITAFSESASQILELKPVYERINPILEATPEVNPITANVPGKLKGEIEVNQVSFRYREDLPLVLDEVSLHIKPGQFIAIVGPSGSGKSSLLRLLLGFEKPLNGSVYYDGQDLSRLAVNILRQQIGTVIQTGKVLPATIFENIVGSTAVTQEEAWQAARLAGLEADIRQMPMGMFTHLSEGGTTLSGGQRQRLMIARALVKQPRILFFDEATSALDNETQAQVSESLEKLQITRVVIAHRLSTIIPADCIYVMQAGRIVQSGSYRELMSQAGPFQELAAQQLA